MIPHSYLDFMVASIGAAAALIGLLFVAISMRADQILGPNAPPRAQALASSGFTSLTNAFALSLLAVIPNTDLGYGAVSMALICFFRTIRLHRNLSSVQYYMLILSVLAFVFQFIIGVIFIATPHSTTCVVSLCYIIFTSFAIALTRAWDLMKGEVAHS